MIVCRVQLLLFLRLSVSPQHRGCAVIPAQAIGLGRKKPTSFTRAESPIYVLQLGGEGWIGPAALTNSRLLKPRPSAWAGIAPHRRCWYSLTVYPITTMGRIRIFINGNRVTGLRDY